MKRVAVIFGGWSSEREVSLSSGKAMARAARETGKYEVLEIDATRNLSEQLKEAKPDVILNGLHGPWGEDGCVQGLLEILQIPYSHSGVAASAVAMDPDPSCRMMISGCLTGSIVLRHSGLSRKNTVTVPQSRRRNSRRPVRPGRMLRRKAVRQRIRIMHQAITPVITMGRGALKWRFPILKLTSGAWLW